MVAAIALFFAAFAAENIREVRKENQIMAPASQWPVRRLLLIAGVRV
jgi:hypothetical protein